MWSTRAILLHFFLSCFYSQFEVYMRICIYLARSYHFYKRMVMIKKRVSKIKTYTNAHTASACIFVSHLDRVSQLVVDVREIKMKMNPPWLHVHSAFNNRRHLHRHCWICSLFFLLVFVVVPFRWFIIEFSVVETIALSIFTPWGIYSYKR